MAKRRGTTSTVWSGWKCVKKMRSTERGSRPDRSMPRSAPEPMSKTSICPPARTTTQLWRLSRRGTTVPDPTTVIFRGAPFSRNFSSSGLLSVLACRVLHCWLLFERPCEPGHAEQGAADDVRGPVRSQVDPTRGRSDEEDQERHPARSARQQ